MGVGFRLGPHADAQIVLELGPQTNTRPLGAAGPSFGSPSSSKRHTALQALDPEPLDSPQLGANPAAGDWLTAWRTSIAKRRPTQDDDLVNQADLSGPPAMPVRCPHIVVLVRLVGEGDQAAPFDLYRWRSRA